MELTRLRLSKTTDTIIKIGAVVAAISAIAGGYSFYLSNIWIPTVKPTNIDYAKGSATITYKNVFGKTITANIYGDATFIVGGNWGVRLGTTNNGGSSKYDRIELTKGGMVWDYIIDA